MNTSMRARHDARGFSFVELLVTIVIAGLIFAAMVPVFVGATKKNSSDSARLQAANVAQDKIEKIRQLPYGAIAADKNAADATDPDSTTPNFYNRYIADGQFGPSTILDTGSGSRTIYTDYAVTLYPAEPTGLESQYKVVTVTARWMAPPAPVKTVVLQTIVYRQYAGPPINAFSTDPGIGDNGVLGGDDLVSVTLSAHMDLTSGATPASLQFTVSAYGGQTIASKLVNATDLNQASDFYYDGDGTFFWRWDCSTAANTVYDLQATALSADNYAGNTMHLYPNIDHTVLPAPPSNVIATAGNAKVSLSWGRSTASDLVSYKVFRAESSTESWPWVQIATIPIVLPATEPATTYRDVTPVNGKTYYYAVRADTSSSQSVPAYSNPATPSASVDDVPPLAPSPVAATPAPAAATVTLTWGAAIDPAPSSGINQYEIWRSPGGTNTWNQIATWTNLANLTYADSGAGWTTTWDYRIRAVDVALNQGAWSATVSATTVAQPFHELRISVQNGDGNDCYVWVLDPATGHYFDMAGVDKGEPPPAPAGTYIAKNSSVTFSHLADGAYTVFAAKGPSPGAKSYGAIVQAPFGTLSGVSP